MVPIYVKTDRWNPFFHDMLHLISGLWKKSRKYHKRRLLPTGKSHKVWMMMMIAEGLMWVEVAGAAQSSTEKLNEQIKTTRLGHNEP